MEDLTKVTQNKPISKAQRKQLVDLEMNVRLAIQQRDSFIIYLREEHDAPFNLWELKTVENGFELIKQNGEVDVKSKT